MKKFLMCIVMMLSMISVNAEENNAMNAEAFHVNVNTEKLAYVLDANNDQAEAISDVMNMFEMQTRCIATESNDSVRKNMMKSAINDNVRLMSSVLNRGQMKTYLSLLNATMQNREVLK